MNWIESKEIIFLWHMDYYDCPLTGVVRYKGNFCWFEAKEDFYVLYSLTDKQLEDLNNWNDRRQKWFEESAGMTPEAAVKLWGETGLSRFQIDLTQARLLGRFKNWILED